jgi:hypothetical protein
MKCPRCGLVHAPLEQVCRRCEIDLRTGEPRSRVQAVAPSAKSTASSLRRLRDRIKAPAKTLKSAGETAEAQVQEKKARVLPGPEPHSVEAKSKPSAFVAYAMSKKTGLPSFLDRFRKKRGTTSITCVQCSGRMAIQRTAPFSRSGPIALLCLGGALIIAGFFFRLLLITGSLSLVLGLVYLRVGHTSWKCSDCGFIIPRAG